MTVRAVHVSDVFLRSPTPLRPFLASADVSGASVLLTYDFAGTGLVTETSSTIRFDFFEDRIEYATTLRTPNGAYASYMRAETSLAWDAPWASRGVIRPDGSIADDNGALLDPLQVDGNVNPYGVFVAEAGRAHAQVRLEQGARVNYLDEGSWRVDTSAAQTSTVFNTFLDAPTADIVSPLWTRDAILFGEDAQELGAAMLSLARPPPPPPRASLDEQVVIGLADTGINPYHVAFRDTSALAYQHPSTYIPGYPANATAVELTFDAPDLDTALAADRLKWRAVEANKLYWFPGTKIVGAMSSGVAVEDENALIFSVGHGTMTSSRAAANEYSLCPECRLVMMQAGNILESDGAEAIRWMAEQEWIDVQSHSWSGVVPFQNDVEVPGARQSMEFAAAQMPVFSSAGNGAVGKLGVLGHPAFTRPMGGAPGVVPVGGHDGGYVTAWTAQYPYVVADACDSWAADGSTIHAFDPAEAGGTSGSTPYTAGEAGRLILEARRALDGRGDRSAGILASGTPRPELGSSPIADGDLTLDELKAVLFRTATARPAFTRDDGAYCDGPLNTPANTLPVKWADYPTDVSAYPFIGWGGIDVHSRDRALAVLHGAPMPVRPLDEEAHAQAEALRAAYHAVEPDPIGLDVVYDNYPTEEIAAIMEVVAAEQDDAGSGGDAPASRVDLIRLASGVEYEAMIDYVGGDYWDHYSFALAAGDEVDVSVLGIEACYHVYAPDGSEFPIGGCTHTDAVTGQVVRHFRAATTGVHYLGVNSPINNRYAFGIGVNEPAPTLELPPQV